jgi:hypothetical protein
MTRDSETAALTGNIVSYFGARGGTAESLLSHGPKQHCVPVGIEMPLLAFGESSNIDYAPRLDPHAFERGKFATGEIMISPESSKPISTSLPESSITPAKAVSITNNAWNLH